MELKQEETPVGTPELTKRQQLDRLLNWKSLYVHRNKVELDTYRQMIEVEKEIRLRIEREEKAK